MGLNTVHWGQDKRRLFQLKNYLEVRSGPNFKNLSIVKYGEEGVIKGIWELSLGVGLFKEILRQLKKPINTRSIDTAK